MAFIITRKQFIQMFERQVKEEEKKDKLTQQALSHPLTVLLLDGSNEICWTLLLCAYCTRNTKKCVIDPNSSLGELIGALPSELLPLIAHYLPPTAEQFMSLIYKTKTGCDYDSYAFKRFYMQTHLINYEKRKTIQMAFNLYNGLYKDYDISQKCPLVQSFHETIQITNLFIEKWDYHFLTRKTWKDHLAKFSHPDEEHIVNRLKNDRQLRGELRKEVLDYNELYRHLHRPINTKQNSQIVYDLFNTYNGKKTVKKLCISGVNNGV
jgi:hypothetical protein